jgi:hypothetical protein
MAEDQKQELARRAVACEGWRWMPGMLMMRVENRPGYSFGPCRVVEGGVYDDAKHKLPDLDDPATIGCLLALVREAWGAVAIDIDESVIRDLVEVNVWMPSCHGPSFEGETLAEALVEALEAAPHG